MSLFLDPTDLDAHGRNLAQLLLIGGVQLETLAKGFERVTFKVWSAAVQKDAQERGLMLENWQTEWLWDALTEEPRVARELGSRILSRDEEWRLQEPIAVLKAGEKLGLFLKPFSSFGSVEASLPSESQPQAWIKLLAILKMEPGKAAARRFECDDVECVVEIDVCKPGTVEQEATLMKVEASEVTVDGSRVIVNVRSLNHAYTVTSRRLEPHRRSHGGRSYDHIAWRHDGQWISLESIRFEVEDGAWKSVDCSLELRG